MIMSGNIKDLLIEGPSKPEKKTDSSKEKPTIKKNTKKSKR